MAQDMVASVLFACNLNRVRSPMAAALAGRLGLIADSCGLEAGGRIDPFAAAAMLEIGVDLTEHEPKTFAALRDRPFDLLVSLTPEAHRHAEEMARGRAHLVEFWPTADPTQESGSREQRMDAYRAVRRGLEKRLAERFGRPSTLLGRSG